MIKLSKDYREFFKENLQDFKKFLIYKGASHQDLDDMLQDFYLRMMRYDVLNKAENIGIILLTLQRTWSEYYERKHRAEEQDSYYGQALDAFDPGPTWSDTTHITNTSLAIHDFNRWYVSCYRPNVDIRHRNAVASPGQLAGLMDYMSSGEVDGKSAEYQRFHFYVMEYRKFLKESEILK